MIFNDRLDAGLALFFMAIVMVVIVASAKEWYLVMAGRKTPRVHEAPYVESRLAMGGSQP
jgi:carbon starvation protein